MRLIDADELNEYIGRESLDTREKIFALVDRMPTLPNPCGKPCAFERPQWIPCSERLPEEYHTYLVTKLDTNPSKSTFTTLAYFYTEETGWDIDDVIAWMPFPKPYQKEGDMDG